MRKDLLRRVRWGNVALALAALVVLVAAASAVLRPAPPPRLPADRAIPLIAAEPTPEVERRPTPTPSPTPQARKQRGSRKKAPRRPVKRRTHPAKPAPASTPAATHGGRGVTTVVAPPTVVVPTRSAPPTGRPAREFGFEGS